jgi:hypothetical protein
MTTACTHLDRVQLRELPDAVDRCEDCLRSGGKWVHLFFTKLRGPPRYITARTAMRPHA